MLEDRFCPAIDYVTTALASGAGSLPQVVANAAPGDTIAFQITQGQNTTITLNSPITISKALTINGLNNNIPGQSVTVSGGGSTGIFQITTSKAVTINNLNLTNGAAFGNGGAISDAPVGAGSLTLNNDGFSSNAATDGGAVYYSSSNGTLTLNSDTFTGNIAVGNKGQGNGGAVYVDGNANITGTSSKNSVFGGNAANNNGAAIYAGPSGAGSGSLSVQNSQFNMNGDKLQVGQLTASPVQNGGAIYASGSGVGLQNDSFVSNNAYVSGGAVYATPGSYSNVSLYVQDSAFNDNTASGSGDNSQGGAIFTQESTSVRENGGTSPPPSFLGNQTSGSGGAIAYVPIPNTSSTLTVNNYTFEGNTAGQYGGALFDYVNNNSTNPTNVGVTVSGSLFNGNKATGLGNLDYGGAVYLNQYTSGQASASFTAVNSTFYENNTDGQGGAIAEESGNGGTGSNTIALTSLTVTGNTAGQYGGGLYFTEGGTTPSLDNCIIAGNTLGTGSPASNGPDVYGSVNSSGYNVVGKDDGSDGWKPPPADHTGTSANPLNPGLASGGPTNNGGPTETIALLTTSDYYEQGDPSLQGQPDQRGYIRQQKVSPGAEDPDAVQY